MNAPGHQLPRVSINVAISADGKIANETRSIESFGSARDLRHLYALRAGADAVMCGAGTANAPNVALDSGGAVFERLRRRRGLAPNPVRLIVSGRARVSPNSAIFSTPGGPVVVFVSRRAPGSAIRRLRGLGAVVEAFGDEEVDLRGALAWTAKEHGVRNVICEGGGALNEAMIRSRLVDELFVTVTPFLFGGRSAPTLADGIGVTRLRDSARWDLVAFRRAGPEAFLRFRRHQDNISSAADLGPA